MASATETTEEIVQLVEAEIKNHKELTQTEGLAFIADRLNEIVDRVEVVERYSPKDSSSLLDLFTDNPLFQETPDSGLQAYDPLKPWKAIEPIVEVMTDQINWRKPSPMSLGSLLKNQSWASYRRNPLPGLSIRYFNNLAHQYPIPLFILKGRGKQIYPEHELTTGMQEALWYLWRFFFHDRGWERLKRCPKCLRWFVDDTRNKQKLRCSPHCTWQWWSRGRRKKEGHSLPELKKTKPRKAKKGE